MTAYHTPGWIWHKYNMEVERDSDGNPTEVACLYQAYCVIHATPGGLYLRALNSDLMPIEEHVKSYPRGRFMSFTPGARTHNFAWPTEHQARKEYIERCEKEAKAYELRMNQYREAAEMLRQYVSNEPKHTGWYIRDI